MIDQLPGLIEPPLGALLMNRLTRSGYRSLDEVAQLSDAEILKLRIGRNGLEALRAVIKGDPPPPKQLRTYQPAIHWSGVPCGLGPPSCNKTAKAAEVTCKICLKFLERKYA